MRGASSWTASRSEYMLTVRAPNGARREPACAPRGEAELVVHSSRESERPPPRRTEFGRPSGCHPAELLPASTVAQSALCSRRATRSPRRTGATAVGVRQLMIVLIGGKSYLMTWSDWPRCSGLDVLSSRCAAGRLDRPLGGRCTRRAGPSHAVDADCSARTLRTGAPGAKVALWGEERTRDAGRTTPVPRSALDTRAARPRADRRAAEPPVDHRERSGDADVPDRGVYARGGARRSRSPTGRRRHAGRRHPLALSSAGGSCSIHSFTGSDSLVSESSDRRSDVNQFMSGADLGRSRVDGLSRCGPPRRAARRRWLQRERPLDTGAPDAALLAASTWALQAHRAGCALGTSNGYVRLEMTEDTEGR